VGQGTKPTGRPLKNGAKRKAKSPDLRGRKIKKEANNTNIAPFQGKGERNLQGARNRRGGKRLEDGPE